MSATTPPAVVVAVGGYRSGSTLQYNLLGEYIERLGLGRRLGWVGPDEAESTVAAWVAAGAGVGIAKCHHVVPGFRPFGDAEAWARPVEAGVARAISTLRPPDAVIRSMARKFGLPKEGVLSSLEWRENVANTARWRQLGAFTQSYDDLTRHPFRALHRLATELSLPRRFDAALVARWRTRRVAVLRHQARLRPGEWDPVNLLHWDHVGRG
jgi:hypothetical protein